jgi:hypothetical protein
MRGDRNRLYTDENDFYELDGSVAMKLSPLAALNVCRSAANHGLVVARIEGGIWHYPGFEARYDCIWDGADPPLSTEAATVNNNAAAEFVERQSQMHGAFILTAPPITGWPHKLIKEPAQNS